MSLEKEKDLKEWDTECREYFKWHVLCIWGCWDGQMVKRRAGMERRFFFATMEGEDYSEEEREEVCEECGKRYHVYQEVGVETHTRPDCELNDERHDWEKVNRFSGLLFCRVCGKWEEDRKAAGMKKARPGAGIASVG